MLFLAVTGYLSDLEQVQLTTLNPKSPHLPHRAGVRADHLNVYCTEGKCGHSGVTNGIRDRISALTALTTSLLRDSV